MVVSNKKPAQLIANAAYQLESSGPMIGVSVRAQSQMLSGCAWRSQSSLALASPAAIGQALPDRIKSAGKVVVANQPNYPPMEYKDPATNTLMGVDIDRLSVKATTTEKLGFTGRGEGIAAQATVLLETR